MRNKALVTFGVLYLVGAAVLGAASAAGFRLGWTGAARQIGKAAWPVAAQAGEVLHKHILAPAIAFAAPSDKAPFDARNPSRMHDIDLSGPRSFLRTAEQQTPPELRPSIVDAISKAPLPQQAVAADPVETARMLDHFKLGLPPEMRDNFDLFLYVSKAKRGPFAQHMYVFQKQDGSDLKLLYNWLVSTGRETFEYDPQGAEVRSHTPQGYYEIDPNRFYKDYSSTEWGQPMPYAMFFDLERDGYKTGLAIHATHGGETAMLGQRASAGCVRLSPDHARTLFDLIRFRYRGLVPRFAFDRQSGTTSTDGILLRDADGRVQYADGYRVLVFIENYGGEKMVAALF